ncbi:MAG: gamma carbonic anhydrase family protein [Verrucomicrobiota bacterium]|nr:gamma carbonic anhydrase family protein [Limisphaera sp.]MDW8381461.1 gamma carbonic anhydrase family protein [Verrucomicrobiota bacterium]
MDPAEGRLPRFCSLWASPRCLGEVYVAPTALVVGDVTLGEQVSLWPYAVLRGDLNRIEIGAGTNLQEHVIVHLAEDRPCFIGEFVTVGHGAVLHACTVEREVLVGMRAIVLDGAVIGAQSIVGAGALVPQGMQVPPGSLVLGLPARVVRPLSDSERASLRNRALRYIELAQAHVARGWMRVGLGGQSLSRHAEI